MDAPMTALSEAEGRLRERVAHMHVNADEVPALSQFHGIPSKAGVLTDD